MVKNYGVLPRSVQAWEKPNTTTEATYLFPATFEQRRLWFLQQLHPRDVSYLIPWSIRISGSLDIRALEQTLNEIVRRHEVLRTTYSMLENGEVVQVVRKSLRIPLLVEDLSACLDPEQQADDRAVEEAGRPLDLERGPVIRARVLRLNSADHFLLLTLHHIAFDQWSRGLLVRELSALYDAFHAGRPSPLPELRLQYADYAVWRRQHLQGEILEKHLAYWKQQLANAPAELTLPTDRPRPTVQTFRGARKSFHFSQSLTERLTQLSRQRGATLFMTLLAGFHALLSRYSGQDDVVVGTPIAGRNRTETEGVIGFFANTLALRLDLSGDPTFEQLIQRTKKMTLDAYQHQEMPFENLVEELNPERSLSHNPLFQALFSLGNLPQYAFELPGLELRWAATRAPEATSKFDISIFMHQQPDHLAGRIEYNTDLFDKDRMGRMIGHYQVLLEAVANNPELRLSELPLLTAGEEEQILVEWNATTTVYPRDLCLHQLFEQQVTRTPDAVACVFEQDQLSYRELNERANQLAHYLKHRGIGPGQNVGVYVERSLAMMVALLGVQKSGAAYVPLDPAYPPERIRLTLEDAQAPVLLTESSLLESLPANGGEIICLDRDGPDIAQQGRANPPNEAGPEDLIYVMFTSGSTGRPKGVQVPHRAVVNLLSCMKQQLRMGPDDVFPALASFAFDMCIPELYLPLVSGGRVVVARRDLAGDGEELAKFLLRHGATVVHATPTTWILLLQAEFTGRGLKRVIGAEALPPDLCRRLLEADATLYNYYGPTETTVWSAMHCFRAKEEPVVIGRPLANTQIYILDRNLRPAPIGVTGEIFIGGDGVAGGYLNRPELTAEKFLADPFSPNGRLYRTGDLARFRPGGIIEYLGRGDKQVKIRGFRIELGEVETVLGQHPAVAECVVTAREDVSGDKRLVAYIVAAGQTALTAAELRQHVQAKLPYYMVPSAFVLISALPLSPNGKVDRKALPAPEHGQSELKDGYAPPRTPLEAKLVSVWSEVLRNPRVGVHDDFFELGGHSLLAVRLCARMEQALNLKLPLHLMFTARTIEQIAASIVGSNQNWAPAKSSIIPCRVGGTKPPIFAAPPDVGLEVLLAFRGLTRRLEPDQPMYTFAKLDRDREWTSLEELAAHYVKDLREFQPQGPYHLVGWSFGGMIAFEMACQLRIQNQAVGLLGLLDAGNLAVWRGRTRRQRFHGALRRLVHGDLKKLRTLAPLDWPRRLVELLNQYFIDTAWREVYRLYQALLKKGSPSLRTWLLRVAPPSFKRAYGKRAYGTLGEHYLPKVYPGKMVFFQSEAKSSVNALKSWSGFTHEVEVVRVPGNHLTMVDEPQVGVLAAEITKALARCSAHPILEATPQGSESALTLPSPMHSTIVTSNATSLG
jgi:amino acid adenylation domain-containing protein